MGALAFLKSLFDSVTASFMFLMRTQPTDAEREQNASVRKPLEQFKISEEIIDSAVDDIKKDAAVDIANYVEVRWREESAEDRKRITQLLFEKVLAFRQRYPVKYKKWLKANKE